MRPIKFRAWDKAKKRMSSGFQPFTQDGITRMYNQFFSADVHEDSPNIDDLEYQQFTGLLDKNGKEIYEGDIIVYEKASFDPSEGEDPAAIEEVKWGEGCFITGTYELWELTGDAGVEVLGNIYEQPELLK